MKFFDLRHLPSNKYRPFSGLSQPSEEQEVLGNAHNFALNYLYVASII